MDRSLIFGFSLLYLCILLGIGVFAVRRNRDARDFFLAGGRLGLITAAFATMAAIMSGFTFVGGPGLFYRVGLGSFWIIISSSFTGTLMCWVLAKPLFRMARKEGCLTIPEVLLNRYRCRYSATIAALAVVIGAVGYLATQLRAIAVILSAVFPMESESAAAVAIGVLVFYSVAGGMVAGVYTDVVQGAIMLWVSTVVGLLAIGSTGGLRAMSATLMGESATALSPWGSVGALTCLGWFVLFSVGSLGQPHVVNRFMMVRRLNSLRFLPLLLALTMVTCGLIWLGGGAAARVLVARGEIPPLDQPDQAIVLFLQHVAPAWVVALSYVGVLAAIMSTADSFVSVGAAALTRDLKLTFGGKGLSVPDELRWGRLWSLVIFALAGILANASQTLLAYLGIFAFGCLAAALTPSLAIGLNWPAAGKWAARSSLVVGLTSSLLLEALQHFGFYGFEVPPAFLALVLSLLAFLVLGKVEENRATL